LRGEVVDRNEEPPLRPAVVLPAVDLPVLGLTPTYGLVRATYLVLALFLTLKLNERRGITPRTTLVLFAIGIPAGVVGARVLDVFEYWDRYVSLADVVGPQGSSIYGAFGTAFFVTWWYGRSRGVNAIKVLDGAAPAMALGEGMTRVACFLNGCCYGIESDGPLAIAFPPGSFAYRDQVIRGLLLPGADSAHPVIAVQLISAVVSIIVTGGLIWLAGRARRTGVVFCAFLIFYGILRLAVAS
jgi:phosphatidylglycerol:prolipoprotein diacylglycerol transferase